MGKAKYYAIRTEFQERGSPHIHPFIWIFNATNIQNEDAHIEFIEKTIHSHLRDHLNNPELFELVKTYQVHAESKTCWKYNKNECQFSYGRYFTDKTVNAKPLDRKFSDDEKQEVLTWRNVLLKQVKSYVDNNLNPAKVNVIGPTKDNFSQSLSVKQILDEVEISADGCYRALPISKNEDLKLHLKRHSCS